MTKSGLDRAGQDDIPTLWKENKWIGTFRSSNKPCKTRFLTLSQFQPFSLLNPFVYLPAPSTLTNFWRIGSILGLCLKSQLVTGLLLSSYYRSSLESAFSRVLIITSESSYGWVIRFSHANGASVLFFLIFTHVARGLYFNSPRFPHVWFSGLILLIGFIGVAFLGYVLPWGQISFWGATVITSLVSTVPYWGSDLVTLLWGGFSVGAPTLSRFFAFHFLIPWVLAALVIGHLAALHEQGSSNPLGLTLDADKIPFTPYFVIKDLIAISLLITVWGGLCCWAPWWLGDADNFLPANPIVTPEHIKPEWYFLFAYSILRAIPNKLGGVLGLLASLLVLTLGPLVRNPRSSVIKSGLSKGLFWSWASIWVLLGWAGGKPVEAPYVSVRQALRVRYFTLLVCFWLSLYRVMTSPKL